MHKRYGRKNDSNQGAVMFALRQIGCIVFDIQEPFDLLVDWREQWHVIEVKNPETHARKKGGSKLTEIQEQLIEKVSAKVYVVETAKEAVDYMAAVPRPSNPPL